MASRPKTHALALPVSNPIQTRADWQAMRSAALSDPGAFHGDIAARTLHWFVADAGAHGAWLSQRADGSWSGWDALSGEAFEPTLADGFTPWATAFDDSDAPHWRWFTDRKSVV